MGAANDPNKPDPTARMCSLEYCHDCDACARHGDVKPFVELPPAPPEKTIRDGLCERCCKPTRLGCTWRHPRFVEGMEGRYRNQDDLACSRMDCNHPKMGCGWTI